MTTPQDRPADAPRPTFPGSALPAAAIPADLSPADAGALGSRLLDALAAARDGGRPLAVTVIGPGTGPGTGLATALPCARQLLAALERSAAAAGVELHLDPGAEAARLPLDAPAANACTE